MSKQIVENYIMHIECDTENGDLTKLEAADLAIEIKNSALRKTMRDATEEMISKAMANIGQKISKKTCDGGELKGYLVKVGVPDSLGDLTGKTSKELLEILEMLADKKKQMCKKCPEREGCPQSK